MCYICTNSQIKFPLQCCNWLLSWLQKLPQANVWIFFPPHYLSASLETIFSVCVFEMHKMMMESVTIVCMCTTVQDTILDPVVSRVYIPSLGLTLPCLCRVPSTVFVMARLKTLGVWAIFRYRFGLCCTAEGSGRKNMCSPTNGQAL